MNRQYDYKPSWTIIFFCGLFFGACALVTGAKAMGNDRGLIINGIIELSPHGATVFYWVLTALGIAFVFAAALLAVTRLTLQQRIVLGESGLIIPRFRWSREEVSVPFTNVLDFTITEVSGHRFAKIVYEGGKFTVTKSMLPEKEAFDEICAAITAGVEACRSQGH